MKKTTLLSLLAGTAMLGATSHAAMITVGVYDEATTDENTGLAGIQNNAVDADATSAGTGNLVSLTNFKSSVLAAFNDNLGGVVNFDNGTVDSGTSFNATYGTSQSKTITITNGSLTDWQFLGNSTNRTAISHPGNNVTGEALAKNGGTPAQQGVTDGGEDFVFNFNAADKVTMVGGTLLSRSGSSDNSVTALVTFSDATTDSVNFTSSGSSNGGNDTFAGFKSPDGLFITQFKFELQNNFFRGVDDLGFVTVPEPSTFAMLLGGVGVLLMRRRRRRRC